MYRATRLPIRNCALHCDVSITRICVSRGGDSRPSRRGAEEMSVESRRERKFGAAYQRPRQGGYVTFIAVYRRTYIDVSVINPPIARVTFDIIISRRTRLAECRVPRRRIGSRALRKIRYRTSHEIKRRASVRCSPSGTMRSRPIVEPDLTRNDASVLRRRRTWDLLLDARRTSDPPTEAPASEQEFMS